MIRIFKRRPQVLAGLRWITALTDPVFLNSMPLDRIRPYGAKHAQATFCARTGRVLRVDYFG